MKRRSVITLGWLVGLIILIASASVVFIWGIGAALGPMDMKQLIIPLLGFPVGTVIIIVAIRKTIFKRNWKKWFVLIAVALPIVGLSIMTTLQAGAIFLAPYYKDTVVIYRNVVFDRGWHFQGGGGYFPFSDTKVFECVKKLDTKNIQATLEVTAYYGKVSFFRVLRFGECEVQLPVKNPNRIYPPYDPGEETGDRA